MSKSQPDVIHYLDGARGQYIPRDFACAIFRSCISGVSADDLDYLARGPGGCLDEDLPLLPNESVRGEHYWDVWTTVTDNAIITDPTTGYRYRLYQVDSLYLVPEDWDWDDSTGWFVAPITAQDAPEHPITPLHTP